ncbi:SDR family NAD(P)-dependent oxidoreductase [Hydrogenophaga sp. BPS33]|uniref:SDR family NAD(P)-dependent oxidoreductase n=1 Tax=Hydrogenophaga sp. BPS33 TaxID=2651974 RepID=UPI00135BCEB9|nr:SDR family NAD(P)-dependent oxidoreductase [Hydrogenophaga sp. BPS33]
MNEQANQASALQQRWSAPPRFKDKIIIITAAAAGIGAATARRMASEGGRIIGVDTDATSLAALIAELPGKAGRHAPMVVNCLDEAAVMQCVRQTVEFSGGRIDVLVNGVGGSTLKALPAGGTDRMALEDWNALLNFNLTPTFLFCKHVMPVMMAQRAGKIVNLSSIAGRGEDASVGNAAYSTAKAGVSVFTKRLSREMAAYGVNCNAVAPGATQTPRILRYYDSQTPEVRAQAMEKTPLGRMATAEDQANAIAFLASNDADFITGVVLDVTGGH